MSCSQIAADCTADLFELQPGEAFRDRPWRNDAYYVPAWRDPPAWQRGYEQRGWRDAEHEALTEHEVRGEAESWAAQLEDEAMDTAESLAFENEARDEAESWAAQLEDEAMDTLDTLAFENEARDAAESWAAQLDDEAMDTLDTLAFEIEARDAPRTTPRGCATSETVQWTAPRRLRRERRRRWPRPAGFEGAVVEARGLRARRGRLGHALWVFVCLVGLECSHPCKL